MDVIDTIRFSKQEEKSRDIIQEAYLGVFNSPAGKIVLTDLMNKTSYGTRFCLNDINQQYYQTGLQHVIEIIKEVLNEVIEPDVDDEFDETYE